MMTSQIIGALDPAASCVHAWKGSDPEKQYCAICFESKQEVMTALAERMARLLLKLEWGGERRGERCCPSCFFRASNATLAHAADCELAAVLRAAGCLP